MQPTAEVTLYTVSHILRGSMAATQRVQETLSDPMHEHIALEDVDVSPLAEPNVAIEQLRHALTPKQAISLVVIRNQGHEAPAQRLAKRRAKAARPVFVTVDGYDVSGTIHIEPRAGTEIGILFRTELTSPFLAVTEATIGFGSHNHEPTEAGVVLVNRSRIGVLSLLKD